MELLTKHSRPFSDIWMPGTEVKLPPKQNYVAEDDLELLILLCKKCRGCRSVPSLSARFFVFNVKCQLWTREEAQLVTCLPCKHEDLRVDLSTHGFVFKAWSSYCPCNFSVCGVCVSLELAGSQSCQ